MWRHRPLHGGAARRLFKKVSRGAAASPCQGEYPRGSNILKEPLRAEIGFTL